MRRFIVMAGLLLLASVAFASDQTEVMKPVQQFVEGFNKGDVQSALAACADQVFVIDEFPPYQWSGVGACSTWANDYVADSKKNGITDGLVTMAKPRHVDVMGDRAYVVVPASYSWKQNGKPMKETGAMLTVALQKQAAGWRITAWTWTKQ